MAKKTADTVTETAPTLDLSAFLPQGMDPAELIKIGGLRPIAAAEVSFENGTPVAGWVVGILDMPPRLSIDPKKRQAGEKEPWSAIVVELTAPTTAFVGEESVTVEAGKEVIIPVNANLKNNRELYLAAFDPKNVFWCLFAVTGQVDLGGGRNAMWDYDVKLHPKPQARTAKYQLVSARPTPALGTGEVIDANGAPAGNLFATA